ncbi:hypothetical protein D6C90_04007 [Aureobasidium pullulans]|uniref:Uncharacterized protein n=1 Tax=Aureobasidium pullulans TaxID=5580 RepID=A0A4S9V752_AURPU|nr:hypothetical protein D6C90_04007 [Aureobasidium pullulans]
MSVTSSRKSNAEKWLIAARSERQVLRFVEQSLIGYDDTYKKYMDTVWPSSQPSDSPSKQLPKRHDGFDARAHLLHAPRTTTLPPLLGTSHPTNHPYERDSLKDEINMESKFEWPGNVRRSTPPHNSFKMNMRACARRATAQKGRLAKSEDPKKVTSPRCYGKEHQRRPSSLTEWTWDEHDSNMPCGAPVNPFTQGAAAGHAGAPQAGPPVATAPQPGAEDGIAAVIRRGSSSRKSSSRSTPTQATLDGFGAPLIARMDAQATRNVCKSCDGLVSGVTDPAHPRGYQCYKGWKDDRDVIAIGSRQVSQPCYQMAVQSQPGQGALFSAPRHFSSTQAHSCHSTLVTDKTFHLNMTRAACIQPGSTVGTFYETACLPRNLGAACVVVVQATAKKSALQHQLQPSIPWILGTQPST